MPLRSRLGSVFRPVIRTERELVSYVVRVVGFCGALALTVDVVNQLAFFTGWNAAFRSWVITVVEVVGISSAVAYAIARSHLDLYRAKLVVDVLSQTDPLTGLLNRRALFEPGDGTLPQIMALVIVDIDRFKTVNDTYGHRAGDEVIKMVGHAMQAELGMFGRVGRIGGEEFALVSASGETKTLIDSLWNFRDRIASTPIVVGSARVSVSISAGVASRKEGQTFEDLFVEADRALYLAKASGRNRIVSAADAAMSGATLPADDAGPNERGALRARASRS